MGGNRSPAANAPCSLDAKQRFSRLAYSHPDELIFGKSLFPVRCGFGLEIGGGIVLPEVNYTLPPMDVAGDFPRAAEAFRTMVGQVLERAVLLRAPGVVLEFEHTFDLTATPAWGAEITRASKGQMRTCFEQHGLKSALRVTVADIRDRNRPPLMRKGPEYERMIESFELCAAAGADILSIESTGGKEVTDPCIQECDLAGVLFGVGVLGSHDMEFLWDRIVEIADRAKVVPGGDTDCAHANTAMRLAHMNYVPQTFAAVVRAIGAARSLVAFERGAIGPHKDCGYEGIILKAITGMPISMEGKSSACAHGSFLGNVASAACDLWSNESVQHVRLLGGFAPEVFTEILTYDCRLMNEALKSGNAKLLRDWLVASDISTSPEAFVLAPQTAFRIAEAIVAEDDAYRRALSAARAAAGSLQEAVSSGTLILAGKETAWLRKLARQLAECPEDTRSFIRDASQKYGHLFLPGEYGIA